MCQVVCQTGKQFSLHCHMSVLMSRLMYVLSGMGEGLKH